MNGHTLFGRIIDVLVGRGLMTVGIGRREDGAQVNGTAAVEQLFVQQQHGEWTGDQVDDGEEDRPDVWGRKKIVL